MRASAKAFAKQRNVLFDRAKKEAGALFEREFDRDALLENPEKYMRFLYAKLGTRVARSILPEARKVGREHAEGLNKARHPDT